MSDRRTMTTYTTDYEVALYDRKGRVQRTLRLTCENDEQALEEVARLRHPNALELWEGNRLVWRFDARPIG